MVIQRDLNCLVHVYILKNKTQLNKSRQLTRVKIQFRHLHRVNLAVLLTKTEYDDGGKIPLHDHFHDFKNVCLCGIFIGYAATPTLLVTLGGIPRIL